MIKWPLPQCQCTIPHRSECPPYKENRPSCKQTPRKDAYEGALWADRGSLRESPCLTPLYNTLRGIGAMSTQLM